MTPSPLRPCPPTAPRRGRAPWLAPLTCLVALSLLAACSSQSGRHTASYGRSTRYYPPPGPPEDPWGPYIDRASARFGIPDTWIREVMRRESAGRPNAYSSAGAMGLMQLMPGTYAELQIRYGLGDDPYEPLNNIMAGSAYIRQMYDRFGAPGFLAAYNAGPRRLDDYLSSRRDLPNETVNYVAAIAPRLGPSTPMSGPLAVYAGNPAPFAVTAVTDTRSGGCDLNAAYDPTQPCTSGGWQASVPDEAPIPAPVVVQVADPAPVRAAIPAAVPAVAAGGQCDPDAAYDPTRPCIAPPRGVVTQEALAAPTGIPAPTPPSSAPVRAQPAPPAFPSPLPSLLSRANAAPLPSPFRPAAAASGVNTASAMGRGWSVQVGAFSTTVTARMAAERARTAAPRTLQQARLELSSVERNGTGLLYRARLTGLTSTQATEACASLTRASLACAIVRPESERFW
ncbi:MAG: transglycosylase SLT domain-containing protein [Acetobacteraceae bacterium]